MKGLARICKDGIDSISGGIRELEAHGYLIRARVRGANGQLGSIEYTILEQPKAPSPTQEKPIRENPVQANPMLDAPIQENPAQLNKEESSNYPSKTDLSITQESSPILSSPPVPRERSGQDGMRKRESYRALILENIEYDVLSQNVQLDKDRLDELVELMVDTVCSNREMIRVAGDDYPAEVVRSRFLKLNASHIEYDIICVFIYNVNTVRRRIVHFALMRILSLLRARRGTPEQCQYRHHFRRLHHNQCRHRQTSVHLPAVQIPALLAAV